jgi:hypothetical protein
MKTPPRPANVTTGNEHRGARQPETAVGDLDAIDRSGPAAFERTRRSIRVPDYAKGTPLDVATGQGTQRDNLIGWLREHGARAAEPDA